MKDLKVGTKVRIKSDLVEGRMYNGAFFADGMQRYAGKETKIESLTSHRILLERCGIWSWTPEMFDVIE